MKFIHYWNILQHHATLQQWRIWQRYSFWRLSHLQTCGWMISFDVRCTFLMLGLHHLRTKISQIYEKFKLFCWKNQTFWQYAFEHENRNTTTVLINLFRIHHVPMKSNHMHDSHDPMRNIHHFEELFSCVS